MIFILINATVAQRYPNTAATMFVHITAIADNGAQVIATPALRRNQHFDGHDEAPHAYR